MMFYHPLDYNITAQVELYQTIVDVVSSFYLGHVISSLTAHVGKTKVDLKESSKFVTG